MSIEKLLDKVGMGKNAVTYLLKNALAEGSEEITGNAVNWLADVMISQDKSEWQETLLYYRALGFSEDEAFLAAMKEQGKQLLKDGAAGAITGTITAGGRLAGSKIGDGIQSYRNYREAVQNGKQYYALNQLTQGGLARSLGNMNVEQSYRSMSPEAILKNSGLSPTEARFLLESNGYSVEEISSSSPSIKPYEASSKADFTQNIDSPRKMKYNAVITQEVNKPATQQNNYLQKKLDYIWKGEKSFVPERAEFEKVITMAGDGAKTPIRDISRLVNSYGSTADRWKKQSGEIISDKYVFDIHWYESDDGIQHDVKLKWRKEKNR